MGDRIKNHLNRLVMGENTKTVSGFYSGTKVFVTGATGFVGKALVEKLLRSCDRIDAIFILLRPKRGIPVEQRLKDLIKNPVFNKIKNKNPDVFEKIKVIPGDVGLPNLGLSEEDRNFLLDNIDVVFHSAATVKFNESLKTAVTLNTLGTKRILELCQKMINLKSCVYVSTAFSNSDKRFVEEKVYEPPYDANAIISLVENLPEEVVESLSAKLVGKHPNTYTFAKALAEQLVIEHSNNVPTAIVRPSIITAAWKEPYPGWVDNLSGITGIMMECGRGTVKSILCDDKCRMDLVPVDVVVNTLITSAWHATTYSSNEIRVYNCTNGKLNPLTWKEFGEFTHKHSRNWPSKYVTWYPEFRYTTNRFVHSLYTTFFHNVPSLVLDLLLYCTDKKPMMLKMSRRLNQALAAGSFFSTNEWEFGSESYKSLISALEDVEDGSMFTVDLSLGKGFDWDEYVATFLKGIREFILKDELSSLPIAKKKLNRLYWFKKILQTVPCLLIVEMARYTYKLKIPLPTVH